MRRFLPPSLILGLLSLLGCLALLDAGTYVILTTYKDAFLFFDTNEFLLKDDWHTGGDEKFDAELGWIWDRKTGRGERPSRYADLPLAVAAFGDSFVVGGEVEDGETWEEALAERLGGAVLNYGQSAYSNDQTLLLYRRIAAHVKAPVVLFGVTSQNINTNVNIYRKFYYQKTGMVTTKPRYILQDGALTLIPNPIQTEAGRKQLRDARFVLSMGAKDWWYNREGLPVLAFPYSRIYFDPAFWEQITYGHIGRKINDVNPRPWEDLWKDEEATQLTLAILQASLDAAAANGSYPLLLHLPGRDEVSAYVASHAVPTSVNILRRECELRQWHCLFPLYDMPQIFTGKPEDWFQPGGHYSPAGNRALASWLHAQLRQDRLASRYLTKNK